MTLYDYLCEVCDEQFESTEVLSHGEILCDDCAGDYDDEDIVELDDNVDEDDEDDDEDELDDDTEEDEG